MRGQKNLLWLLLVASKKKKEFIATKYRRKIILMRNLEL